MEDYWRVQVQRVPPPSTVPPVRVERRCATCGYGAYLAAPERATVCPICHSTAWLEPRRSASRRG